MDLRLIVILLILLAAGCAQQKMPTGGEVDTEAPILVDAEPAPMSTGFAAKQIELSFNEYIQLQSPRQQVLISPPLDEFPEIEIRGAKRLLIDLSGITLREQTTYTINLGEAVSDYNEGNVLQENVYLFSTGDYIDSLQLSGQVLQAAYLKPCEGCLAMLFPLGPDSSYLDTRPIYMAKTDSEGRFLLSNLAEGSYRLMALKDANADLEIALNEEMGFADRPLVPMPSDSVGTLLKLFEPQSSFSGIADYQWSEDGRSITLVTAGLEQQPVPMADAAERLVMTETLEGREDSIRYWFSPVPEDLDELVFAYQDMSDSLPPPRNPKTDEAFTLALEAKIAHEEADLLLSATTPLFIKDSAAIRLLRDSVEQALTWESEDAPTMELLGKGDFEEGVNYTLALLPGAIEDAYGRSNDSLRIAIQVPSNRSLGLLRLDIQLPLQDESYFIELLDKKSKVIAKATLQGDTLWTIPYLAPMAYRYRVVSDLNSDGAWTTGDFATGRQPEPVFMSPAEVNVKANWEIDQAVIVTFR